MSSLRDLIGSEGLPEREQRDFECVPDGWYQAEVVSADVRQTKAGTGSYLSVQFAINGPSHAGRRVWQNYNLRNPSATAERIGREHLGELVRALGIGTPQDSDELIGNACEIRVTTKEQQGYPPRNEVIGARSPATPAPATAKPSAKKPAAAPAAAGGSAPPWARK